MIKNPNYAVRSIGDRKYLLGFGQACADMSHDLMIDETGEFLWNMLDTVPQNVPGPEGSADPASETDAVCEYLTRECMREYECEEEDYADVHEAVSDFVHILNEKGIFTEEDTVKKVYITESDKKADGLNFDKNYYNYYDIVRRYRIAGLNLLIEGDSRDIPKHFSVFECTAEETAGNGFSDCDELTQHVYIGCTNIPIAVNFGRVLINNELLSVAELDGGYYFRFPTSEYVSEAVMSADGRNVRISHHCGDHEEVAEDLFQAMRVFFLYFAQLHGLMAIHSSSVINQEKAILFSAQSGVGKSTHAGLWQQYEGAWEFNGDINLVGFDNGRAKIYGIPWCGTSQIFHDGSYELSGIVLLEQAPKNYIIELNTYDKVLKLLHRSISPVWTQEQLDACLTFDKRLADCVPIFKLGCTISREAVETVKSRIT